MIEKIDHINLTVTNLEESLDWYAKVFGFEKVESGRSVSGPYAIVSYNDFAICMYEEKFRKSAAYIEHDGFHQIYHFGIRVGDANAWRATVKKNSLKLYYGGEITYPRSTSWYVRDPSGHEIEVSYTDKGLWGLKE